MLIHCPINKLSLGQVSYNILKEFYKEKLTPFIVPIGQVDLSTVNKNEGFEAWLQQCIKKTFKTYKRDIPCLKIWHINGSLESYSKKQVLYTFHELDQATEEEINIVNNQHHTVFSSKYSTEVFWLFGGERISNFPLGFDSDHFKDLNLKKPDSTVQWFLGGKFEHRKHHAKIIRTWCSLFGGQKEHRLNLAVTNPFFDQNQHNALFGQVFGGEKPWNVNILSYLTTNAHYNQLLNFIDIDLTGLAGAEGFNLPAFQATALGKWSVVLDATGHKEWATKENSILVEPDGKIPVYDNMFFAQGQPFNQGNIFNVSEDKIKNAMQAALNTYESRPVNENGKQLQQYTYRNLFEYLTNLLN